jgi:hypothetical protein
MKRSLSLLPLLLLLASCAAIAPGSDPVLVNAERTTAVAIDAVDTYLQWEFDNRETLSAIPEIRETADYLRRNAPTWFETAREITKSYKVNRTEYNRANLNTAMNVLNRAIIQAQRYLPKK